MKNWWEKEDVKSLGSDEGDGQRFKKYYTRKYKDEHQYAIVTYTDDGYRVEAAVFAGGKLKYYEYEECDY